MATNNDRLAVEYAKCAADVAYFTHTYLVIDDAQGDSEGVMPFHLWPCQVRVLWDFLLHPLIIILKARQLGISWLCCAYALWLCLFQPGKVVLMFSKGQLEANELLRRVCVLYERLPSDLLACLPRRTKNNTEVQEWANGSKVLSLSVAGGRSFTASLAIMDEAAHNEFASKSYDAIKPTIDGGGQLIVLSTANGFGNLFHQLWTKAAAALNSFHIIFLPWWARPGRDKAWYQRKLAEATDPAKVKQEYPASATEAFIASGRSRFAAEWVEVQDKNVCAPLSLTLLPAALQTLAKEALAGGTLSVYNLPIAGRRYVLGADVAEGLAHGDYSCAIVLDAVTWEEMASLHGHWEPDTFADLLSPLADFYNLALKLVERNNHGHAVLTTLKRDGAQNVGIGPDGKPGWLTTQQSKPQAIDLLAEALRDELCVIHSQATLDELQIYRTLDNGSTSAPDGYHDDRVMMLALALQAARVARVGTAAVGGARFDGPSDGVFGVPVTTNVRPGYTPY